MRILPLALLLAACDQAPPAPTEADNRQLGAAEAMLDEAPNSLSAIDDTALDTRQEKGPPANASGPP